MKLTARQVDTSKAKDKPYKLSDGGGLYLLVNSNGSRYWRLKYRIAGKEKLLALGVYPDVSLADARQKRSEAKKILSAGGDPGQEKLEEKQARVLAASNSFEHWRGNGMNISSLHGQLVTQKTSLNTLRKTFSLISDLGLSQTLAGGHAGRSAQDGTEGGS